MIISFQTHRLEKEFNDEKLLRRRWGAEQARLIQRRMSELAAAENLAVLRKLPQVRAHELKGRLAGRISLDVRNPYRLLIVPDHEEIPLKDDGGLDWQRVTRVKILGVEDTHG